ncbi:protein kinase family protein [Streptomyces sp. NPDC059373]
MAERSTAAVGVANESGDTQPLAAQADSATADDATDRGEENDAPQQTIPEETAETAELPDSKPEKSAQSSEPPELHSGHKLARRYRLEECLTRIDGFSSWRAVDEKLRRAVGIHILPADHSRARPVLAAARSAALLGDPRFVQVLDAVEENDLVYVIHEWLPDATDLTAILAAGPQEAHDCYQMASQVAQAMAAAHREGLSHLQLSPDCVLRTESGQYRIRGLAVAAALHGVSSDRPQREDTEAIGALLYASLTQRWPYPEDQYGLTGLPKDVGLVAPDQVRARVHRGLSEVSMRALVNDGATASRELQPCATPEELAKAIATLPKIRPPETARPPGSPYQRTTYQQGAYRQPPARQIPPGPPTAPLSGGPPPALPGGRTGKALKWAVSSLLIAALGLGSWQLADTLMNRQSPQDNTSAGASPSASDSGGTSGGTGTSGKRIVISGAKDFDPEGQDGENPDSVSKAYDGDAATYWETSWYNSADFGNLKSGVGLILDLGKSQRVGSVKVNFIGDTTSVELRAASSSSSMPTSLSDYSKVASGTGTTVTLKPDKTLKARYVLVWLTNLPQTNDGHYRGRISEINVTS